MAHPARLLFFLMSFSAEPRTFYGSDRDKGGGRVLCGVMMMSLVVFPKFSKVAYLY